MENGHTLTDEKTLLKIQELEERLKILEETKEHDILSILHVLGTKINQRKWFA
ncbi:hypothetical protein [Salibacterium aidingense]|uniref:hypothetical protein n=1 Tax=Salibacterium aidingense TaxID=384933 RepID=UPI0003FF6C2E|nr:hypothetical protein [Salibacterium aidingense]